MTTKKVLILAAGRGTRMGDYAETTHKALLPLGHKAILTRIFEQFTAQHEFIISVGHKADHIRSYVELAHPNLRVQYVEVDRFDGPGSGPGYSAYCARDLLHEPFYLTCADTLWSEPLNDQGNWLGTFKVSEEESRHYCNLEIDGRRGTAIVNKKSVKPENHRAFIGLAHIKDWAHFFAGLAGDSKSKECELLAGFEAIIKNSTLESHEINSWLDVGRFELYQAAREKMALDCFEKRDEFIYFAEGRVIKFFADDRIVRDRVERSRMNTSVFPKIIGQRAHFYSYDFEPGVNFYQAYSVERFSRLLNWLRDTLWQPVEVRREERIENGLKFYYEKTYQRVANFLKNNPNFNSAGSVQGHFCESAADLLRNIQWHELTNIEATFIHGDLQFANIIYREKTDSFKLIDWRHDFGGAKAFGDLYYDFAKLYSGLLVDLEQVRAGHFKFNESVQAIEFSLPMLAQKTELISILRKFVEAAGFNWAKIELLSGLIFLNMAGLHRGPLDKIFFCLGRQMLSDLQSAAASNRPVTPQPRPN